MSVNLETQKNISTFLSITIDHAMDLYIEQAVDKPKPPDKNVDVPIETETSTKSSTPPSSTSSKKPPTSLENFYTDFDNYLSRLKGCLGQIDILSKLAIACSKNNFFDFNRTENSDTDPRMLNLIKALNDVHERQNAQIEKLEPYKESKNDRPDSD